MQHDRALALYPVPHALVLAGASPMAAHQFQDCVCINPVRGVLVRAICCCTMP